MPGLAPLGFDKTSVEARLDAGKDEGKVGATLSRSVPINDNLPARLDGELLHGLGTCDLKGGDAILLRLAATVPEPNRDGTYLLSEGA